MLATVKPLMLLSGMLFSSWHPGDPHDYPASDDPSLRQVTSATQDDLHVTPALPHSLKDAAGQNEKNHLIGEDNFWEGKDREDNTLSIGRDDWAGRETTERQLTSGERLPMEEKVVEKLEEKEEEEEEEEKEEEREATKDRRAETLEKIRRNLDMKKAQDEQRMKHNSKEEKRNRKRMQQRKKLKKTLQEEMKRKKRLRRIMINKGNTTPPNIIFVLADDLGYNDVPWHNPDIKAPELLRLARQGVVLENHYVLPLCAPSRAALMTGIYPFRYGKQASSTPLSPTGLNTSLTLLPQRLRALGYSTHLVGKWHLGYCNWAYTPTERGFDSFYGYYLGSQTYFTRFKKLGPKKGSPYWTEQNEVLTDHDPHRAPPPDPVLHPLKHHNHLTEEEGEERKRITGKEWLTPDHRAPGGYDFRFNHQPVNNTSGIYSNELYAARAEEVIRSHASGAAKNPLFMMLSLQAVHGPVEVPLEYKRRHRGIKNLNRRTFHGMVSALDEVVGRVVRQLKRSGLYENSIIVFTTDNGGNIRAGGNNFPLRGSKGGVFEGGTRGVAFIHSPLLPRTGYKYTGLMHMVDWYNTLLYAAGGSHPSSAGDEDNTLRPEEEEEEDLSTWAEPPSFLGGEEQGNDIMGGGEEEEEDRGGEEEDVGGGEEEDVGGGSIENDGVNLWPAILNNKESPRVSFVYNVRKRPLRGAIRRKNWKLVVGGGGRYDGWVPPSDVAGGVSSRCCSTWHARTPTHNLMLYNLKDDPLETTDVAALRPDVVANLKARLRTYAIQSRHPHSPRDNPRGHPSLYGGFFSPGWCQPIV